jgi:predicted ArsR family transcriptional regulator
MGDLSDLELGILRYMNQIGRDQPQTAAEMAPSLGLSVEATTDRLNELEWVGYVEEHEGENGSASAFTLTGDGVDAANDPERM